MNRPTISEQRLSEMMREKGIRPSQQRIAVISYVANSRKHPTADEIFGDLSPKFPSLSRTTIYNSLRTFVESGLLYELGTDELSRRYDLVTHPAHAHFLCRKCCRLFDMEMPRNIMESAETGFLAEGVELTLKGICPDCALKQ